MIHLMYHAIIVSLLFAEYKLGKTKHGSIIGVAFAIFLCIVCFVFKHKGEKK